MVHFTQYDFRTLFHSGAGCRNRSLRVTPFGCPRINGYVLLPAAYRSLSRPSSSYGSIGIRHRPVFHLTILLIPPRAPDFPQPFLRQVWTPVCSPASCACFSDDACFRLRRPCFFSFLSYFQRTPQTLRLLLMENKGFEPLTLGLQSRCSSQLS